MVKDLLAKITEYEKGSVLPQDRLPDSRADPANFGGAWTPWLGLLFLCILILLWKQWL